VVCFFHGVQRKQDLHQELLHARFKTRCLRMVQA